VRVPARPLSDVPAWLFVLLSITVAAQIGWQASRKTASTEISDLPPAPSVVLLRIASFGEPEVASRLAMLYLQAYDLRGDNAVPYQRLDYGRLVAWLRVILRTDDRSSYALFSAARIYAEIPDADKCRTVLEYLREAFADAPDRRWHWLAHAALVAKHRLHDLPLALRYARAIDREVRDPSAPLWAKQMQAFILEDMNELEAANVMLGGLIASGRVSDPRELRFLQDRLRQMQRLR